jgi:hypothetical protein
MPSKMGKARYTQSGCQTPKATGTKYRVWVYREHYDHCTRQAAERRVARMSWYEQQAATIEPKN